MVGILNGIGKLGNLIHFSKAFFSHMTMDPKRLKSRPEVWNANDTFKNRTSKSLDLGAFPDFSCPVLKVEIHKH